MALIQQVEDMVNDGQFDLALELLSEDKSNEANIKRSVIFEKKGEFEESLRYAKMVSDDEDPLIQIHGLVCETYCYWRLNDLDTANKIIDQGLSQIASLALDVKETTRPTQFKAEFYYLKGILLNVQGKVKEPFVFFKKSYELREKINHPTKSHSLTAMGIIKELMGELIEALEYHEMALELKKEQGNRQDIYRSMSNISELYFKIGNFEKALEFSIIGNSIVLEIGYETEQNSFKNQLALLHDRLGHYEEAEKLYLELLNARKTKCEEALLLADTYSNLIRFYRKSGKRKMVEGFTEEFEKFAATSDNDYINNLVQIEKALDLSYKPRIFDKMKAQELFLHALERLLSFDKYSKGDVLELLTYVIKSLLVELQMNYEESLIEEIEVRINQIEDISKEESLILTQIEALEFRAKLKVIENDIEESKQLLKQAQQLAEEKGFLKRARHIAEEYDRIIIQGVHQDETLSISQRVEGLRINDILSRMTHDMPEPNYISETEIPIQLMILNIGGTPIYSYQFNQAEPLNSILVGSFISAIQSFGDEIFRDNKEVGDQGINRIEHKDYSVYVKKTQYGETILCYICKGPSYPAVKHLLSFSESLERLNYWESIVKSMYSLGHELKNKLDTLSTEVFSKDS